MKSIKMAFAVACAFASTAAAAGVVDTSAKASATGVNTCYYEYSILTADAIYDVYTCYSNGNGTY
jgi:hypothetical protein